VALRPAVYAYVRGWIRLLYPLSEAQVQQVLNGLVEDPEHARAIRAAAASDDDITDERLPGGLAAAVTVHITELFPWARQATYLSDTDHDDEVPFGHRRAHWRCNAT